MAQRFVKAVVGVVALSGASVLVVFAAVSLSRHDVKNTTNSQEVPLKTYIGWYRSSEEIAAELAAEKRAEVVQRKMTGPRGARTVPRDVLDAQGGRAGSDVKFLAEFLGESLSPSPMREMRRTVISGPRVSEPLPLDEVNFDSF